jgi:hypothetical protein
VYLEDKKNYGTVKEEDAEILIIESPNSHSYPFDYRNFLQSSFNDINLGNFLYYLFRLQKQT